MGEFAVGALGLAPLVEQGQDHLDLLRSQPMHPRPARGPVGKPSTCSAAGAAVRSPFGELEPVAGPSDRPAHLEGLVEQAPSASVAVGRLKPCVRRSTGDGPVWSPPQGASVIHSSADTSSSSRPMSRS